MQPQPASCQSRSSSTNNLSTTCLTTSHGGTGARHRNRYRGRYPAYVKRGESRKAHRNPLGKEREGITNHSNRTPNFPTPEKDSWETAEIGKACGAFFPCMWDIRSALEKATSTYWIWEHTRHSLAPSPPVRTRRLKSPPSTSLMHAM